MIQITIDSTDLDVVLYCLVSAVGGESFYHFPPNWRDSVIRLANAIEGGSHAKQDWYSFFNGPEDPTLLNKEGWEIRVNPPYSELDYGELIFLTGPDLREQYPSLIKDGILSLSGYYLNVDTGRGHWLDGPYMTVSEALQEVDLDERIAWHHSHECEGEISSRRHGHKLSMTVPLNAIEVCSIWQALNGAIVINASPHIDPHDFGVALAQAAASQSALHVEEYGGNQPRVVDVIQNTFNDFLGRQAPAGAC